MQSTARHNSVRWFRNPIILIVMRQNTDSAVFKKMKDLLEEYYVEPNKINSLSDFQCNDDDFDPFELKWNIYTLIRDVW